VSGERQLSMPSAIAASPLAARRSTIPLVSADQDGG
jgi:hypothetical protein